MPKISKSKFRVNLKIAVAAAIWMLMFPPACMTAQDDNIEVSKLAVGTMVLPPFAIQTVDGGWEGLSIELWQAIARDMGVEYEFIAYDNIDQFMAEIEKGELDVLIAMAVTASREAVLDLSHAFLTSGSAIAVPAVESRSSLLHFLGHFVDRLASREFLLMIGMLVLLALVAGSLVWLFESRRNREVFSEKKLQGLWQGLWWPMVTMTTVGYGDKAPRSIGGRIAALAWMFTSIILFALYYVSMAIPSGSTLRESLNRALLKIIETDEWLRLKARYIGSGG